MKLSLAVQTMANLSFSKFLVADSFRFTVLTKLVAAIFFAEKLCKAKAHHIFFQNDSVLTYSIFENLTSCLFIILKTPVFKASIVDPDHTLQMQYLIWDYTVANVTFMGLQELMDYYSDLPLIIHFKFPRLFPDFLVTFYSFPYPMTDQKNIFILYFNGVNGITSNLGATLKGKNLFAKGANSFL